MIRARSVMAAALVAALLAGCSKPTETKAPKQEPEKFTYQPGIVAPVLTNDELRGRWEKEEARLTPPRVNVKGIYLTSATAANPTRFKELVDLVDRTELNAMVVNVKDDWGNLTYASGIAAAKAAGAVNPDLDLKQFTAALRAKNIYSIARIVSFKDAYIPKAQPELAIASSAGGIWRDYNGVPWLNPYSQKAWEYLVSIGREAALAGFNEVQFDYVRFPTDGNLSAIVYPGKDGRKREQVIADFLAYARKELRPYGVWVSADVFGLVTSTADDMGIGQRLEEISESVDYISPMVYPSHYTAGNLGVANPNAQPYDTVYRSMLDAKGRWEKAKQGDKVGMRPWLQDFSMGYTYGAKEVRAQIQATHDAGYSQWLLWNAANVYTEDALKPEKHD